jgi:hypothetical protein
MLDAIGTPLALRDFAEYRGTLSQQLVDDPVLSAPLEFLKGVLEKDEANQWRNAYLHDERSSRMQTKMAVPARSTRVP